MDDNSMTSQQPAICPICSNGLRNQKIVSRPNAPVLQNVTLSDRAKALAFPTGRLEFVRCDQCGFVWNEAFDPDLIHYDSGYNNDVSSSAYYRAHLEEMADNILAAVPQGEEIHYVEIGCGDGEFLRLVVERAKGRCVSAVGFDPSYNSSKPCRSAPESIRPSSRPKHARWCLRKPILSAPGIRSSILPMSRCSPAAFRL
ncbi:methyltransferase domain-containing protein [uncultured Cohaesibacter sp.]|uniref:methyltransferase domain-containing protein n=1 Tax=uncultured Cohaesibacter sp. TaxID=1002546 RepID=UPI002AABAF0D|nr:methyltransferase domain-containing protein [uncultured Cohaesibacter sp.]